MTLRMVTATLSLIGLLISTYLWLYKIGALGTLACGTGGCETVQTSEYAVLWGIPVAFYGVGGYGVLMLVSMAGLQPRWIDSRLPSLVLVILSGIGVAFTAYLSYLEAAVIEAWCRWCLASAAVIIMVFAVSARELAGFRTTDNR